MSLTSALLSTQKKKRRAIQVKSVKSGKTYEFEWTKEGPIPDSAKEWAVSEAKRRDNIKEFQGPKEFIGPTKKPITGGEPEYQGGTMGTGEAPKYFKDERRSVKDIQAGGEKRLKDIKGAVKPFSDVLGSLFSIGTPVSPKTASSVANEMLAGIIDTPTRVVENAEIGAAPDATTVQRLGAGASIAGDVAGGAIVGKGVKHIAAPVIAKVVQWLGKGNKAKAAETLVQAGVKNTDEALDAIAKEHGFTRVGTDARGKPIYRGKAIGKPVQPSVEAPQSEVARPSGKVLVGTQGLKNDDFKAAMNEEGVPIPPKGYQSWQDARRNAQIILDTGDIARRLKDKKALKAGINPEERAAAMIEAQGATRRLTELEGEIEKAEGLQDINGLELLQREYANIESRRNQILGDAVSLGSQNGRNLAGHKMMIDVTDASDPDIFATRMLRRAQTAARRELNEHEVKSIRDASGKVSGLEAEVQKVYDQRKATALAVLEKNRDKLKTLGIELKDLEKC